jgi:hypothetical protein
MMVFAVALAACTKQLPPVTSPNPLFCACVEPGTQEAVFAGPLAGAHALDGATASAGLAGGSSGGGGGSGVLGRSGGAGGGGATACGPQYACGGLSVYEVDTIYDRTLYARPADGVDELRTLMLQGDCRCGRQWSAKWYFTDGGDECAYCYNKRLRTMKQKGQSPTGGGSTNGVRRSRNFMVCSPRTRKELLEHDLRGRRKPREFPTFNAGRG